MNNPLHYKPKSLLISLEMVGEYSRKNTTVGGILGMIIPINQILLGAENQNSLFPPNWNPNSIRGSKTLRGPNKNPQKGGKPQSPFGGG